MNIEKIEAKDFVVTIIADKTGLLIRTDKGGVEYVSISPRMARAKMGQQTKTIVRVIRADRESMVFEDIIVALKAGAKQGLIAYDEKLGNWTTDPEGSYALPASDVASGSIYDVTIEPHFSLNSDGTRFAITQGKNAGQPAIVTQVRFFCFEGENPLEQLKQRMRSLEKCVATTDSFDTDTTTEEVVVNNVPVPPTPRR